MKENKLVQRFYYLQKTFATLQLKVSDNPGIREIHKFRLGVKRMRILLEVAEISTHGKIEKNQYLPFLSKIFSKAGEARECQLNRQLLKRQQNKNILPFKNYLNKQLKNTVSRFQKELLLFDREAFNKQNEHLKPTLKELSEKEVNRAALSYSIKRIKSVAESNSKNMSDMSLHKIRTSLKKAAGVASFLTKGYTPNEWCEFFESVKRLEKQIGKWHDYAILIDSMKEFYSSKSFNDDSRETEKIIKRIEKRNLKRKKIIIYEVNKNLKPGKIRKLQTLLPIE